jgi:diguanylate cyclase
MAFQPSLRQRFWPPIPVEIRDEVALLRYEQLQQRLPTVYLTIILVVLTAMMAADAAAPWWVRVGIPGFVTAAASVRLIWWIRKRGHRVGPDAARGQIRRTAALSALICTLCSVWCIASWHYAAPAQQSYYPMFIAMGSLTTAFSVAAIRTVALANLTGGITPIAAALMLFGSELDRVAGAFVAIATLFLVRMINDQHRQLIDLMLLKHRLREQANTDPLTGLFNRRALIELAESAFAANDAMVGLALIDLDGFKAVNDRHGHAAGDELLVQIAGRMQRVAGRDAMVARLGGDEFALLVTGPEATELAARTNRLLAALVPAFQLGGAVITLGASAGMAVSPKDGSDLTDLFAAADSTLYAAKARRDQRAATARRSNRATA